MVAAAGWYGGIYGGYTLFDEEDDNARSFDAEDAARVGGALGYRFDESARGNWRGELDFSYLETDLENDRVPGAVAYRADMNVYTVMARGLYDFKFVAWPRWRPYLGLGLGTVISEADPADGAGALLYGRSTAVFAGEASAGLTYLLSDRIELFSDVRYLLADEPANLTVTAGALPAGAHGETGVDALSMNLGIRYRF
ncbi:MAG: outer membrane beta-barrel protein [Gammaproteobacteria bacterium]|nr:outer membrane beta-barrel protein [Gammaproteobacteria bacterium]MCP5200307.1 outer membrane beta-barrel protein [Gammaproteobacteria bacterium]